MDELTRELAARSTSHEDPTIQRALTVLGQGVNPIKVVSPEETSAIYAKYGKQPSEGVLGFRAPGDKKDVNIYINSESNLYKQAKRSPLAQTLLAGTLAHEQVHNTDGEEAARRIESDFLRSQMEKMQHPHKKELQKRIAAIEHFTK
jgi:hypothetical protein